MYTFWGLENILESIEGRNWDVYGLEADGEKHPHEVFLKRGNKKISVFHKGNGIYTSPRKNVTFDANTGIVNEYHGNKLHMTSYAHLSSPLGLRQVVELSKHPKKSESHLPAIRSSHITEVSDAAETHAYRTHLEQIKHILAQSRSDGYVEKHVPQLKHHLEEIRKISDKMLKEKLGTKERETWEKVHDEAVKYHEFVDEGEFDKLIRSLKMASHTEKDFDEVMRIAQQQKKEDEWWAKAAKDEDFQKKAVAHLNRLAKQSEEESDRIIAEYGKKKGTTIKSDNGGWTSTTVPLGDKKEEASKGFSKAKQELSEGKKGLSLAHKLALGAGGVAAAGALGWATKGRGKAAVKAAEKGWSTGRKAAVGAAGVAGVGAVGYGGYRARHSDKHRR